MVALCSQILYMDSKCTIFCFLVECRSSEVRINCFQFPDKVLSFMYDNELPPHTKGGHMTKNV